MLNELKHRASKKLLALTCAMCLDNGSTHLFSIINLLKNKNIVRDISATKAAFGYIDDHIDENDPDRFIRLSTDSKNGRPSDFLQESLNFLESTYPDNFKVRRFLNMVESKDPRSKDMIKFGNLLCEQIIEELNCKIQGDRKTAAEIHLEISEVNVGLYSYLAKSNSSKPLEIEELDLEKARILFPNATKIGRFFQIHDDISDFKPDTLFELKTGILSSNYLLSKLAKADLLEQALTSIQLGENNDLLNRQIKGVVDNELRSAKAALPPSIRQIASATCEMYYNSNNPNILGR